MVNVNPSSKRGCSHGSNGRPPFFRKFGKKFMAFLAVVILTVATAVFGTDKSEWLKGSIMESSPFSIGEHANIPFEAKTDTMGGTSFSFTILGATYTVSYTNAPGVDDFDLNIGQNAIKYNVDPIGFTPSDNEAFLASLLSPPGVSIVNAVPGDGVVEFRTVVPQNDPTVTFTNSGSGVDVQTPPGISYGQNPAPETYALQPDSSGAIKYNYLFSTGESVNYLHHYSGNFFGDVAAAFTSVLPPDYTVTEDGSTVEVSRNLAFVLTETPTNFDLPTITVSDELNVRQGADVSYTLTTGTGSDYFASELEVAVYLNGAYAGTATGSPYIINTSALSGDYIVEFQYRDINNPAVFASGTDSFRVVDTNVAFSCSADDLQVTCTSSATSNSVPPFTIDRWEFNGNVVAPVGDTGSFTFPTAGTYNVELFVNDELGATSAVLSVSVSVGGGNPGANPIIAEILGIGEATLPVDQTMEAAGEECSIQSEPGCDDGDTMNCSIQSEPGCDDGDTMNCSIQSEPGCDDGDTMNCSIQSEPGCDDGDTMNCSIQSEPGCDDGDTMNCSIQSEPGCDDGDTMNCSIQSEPGCDDGENMNNILSHGVSNSSPPVFGSLVSLIARSFSFPDLNFGFAVGNVGKHLVAANCGESDKVLTGKAFVCLFQDYFGANNSRGYTRSSNNSMNAKVIVDLVVRHQNYSEMASEDVVNMASLYVATEFGKTLYDQLTVGEAQKILGEFISKRFLSTL